MDSDKVMLSNRNRQLLALSSTEGLDKIQVMKSRLMDINPDLNLKAAKVFLKEEKIPDLLATNYDYVVDAIDTLSPKIYFIKNCVARNFKLVSSMGAGGRMDPLKIEVEDISKSYGCTFAQAVRKKLNGLNIKTGFKVVFTPEKVPKKSVIITDNEMNKKSTVGTISYMPAVFGLIAASVVIRDLIEEN